MKSTVATWLGPGFALALLAGGAAAASRVNDTLNFNGVTGLIDMPGANMQPDGNVATTISRFGPITRTTLTFQITPRLQGSFRYIGVKGLNLPGTSSSGVYYDRSFDLRYQLLTEGRWRPAVTVGLQDFIGTGIFAGEYVVAGKTLGDSVRVTGGIGWGRLGSYNAFGHTGVRRNRAAVTGGKPNPGQWFRGPMSAFGGIEWQVNDRLGLKFEYSSDAYAEEAGRQGLFARRSPLSIGAEYRVSDQLRLGAYYLYGSEIGLTAQLALNPRRRPLPGIHGPAPTPVVLRPSRAADPAAWADSWAADPRAAADSLREGVARQLQAAGLVLESLAIDGGRVEVRVQNPTYDSSAQMIGRAARALTASIPAVVETFDIVPVVNGMAAARIRLRRADLEALEHAPANADALRGRITIADAARPMPHHVAHDGRRFEWALTPYVRTGLFDPESPLRGEIGLRLAARYQLAPGLYLAGSVTQRAAGNLKRYNRPSNSVLPHVRTDDYRRNARGTALEQLTLSWYGRPGENLYSRITAGYLERGYGGISGELLWKPVASRLALGAEVNWVKQRSFTRLTGLADYSTVTGHLSAYYAFAGGYHARLDVGRYLAGDVGATLALDREFSNGWRVGAWATVTNVSAARFGEGSFDKGIRVTIPMNWATSRPGRTRFDMAFRPIQRDGGAKVEVSDRLYEGLRDYHTPRIDAQWGRVWR